MQTPKRYTGDTVEYLGSSVSRVGREPAIFIGRVARKVIARPVGQANDQEEIVFSDDVDVPRKRDRRVAPSKPAGGRKR